MVIVKKESYTIIFEKELIPMTKLLCARSWGKLLTILKIKCSSLHDSGQKGESSALVLHAVQFKKSPPAVFLT